MPLATKNGAIIVKDGKLAENCGCCEQGGWYCYAPCLKAFASPIRFVVQGRTLDPSVTSTHIARTGVSSNYPDGQAQETWRVLGGLCEYYRVDLFTHQVGLNEEENAEFGWSQVNRVNAGSYSGSEIEAYAQQQVLSRSFGIFLQLVPVTSCQIIVKIEISQSINVQPNPQAPQNAGVIQWDGYHAWRFNPVINADDFTSPLSLDNSTASTYPQEFGGVAHTYRYAWFSYYLQQYPSSIINKPCPEFAVSVLCDSLEDPRCLAP